MTLVYCQHSDHWRIPTGAGDKLPNYRDVPWNCTKHKVKPRYRFDYAQNKWVEVK